MIEHSIYYLLDIASFTYLFFCLKGILGFNKNLFMPMILSILLLGILLYFYITSDTKLINVWMNSNTNTPLLYKIAGVWGNHQGSMLMLLTLFSVIAYIFFKDHISIRISSFVLLAIGVYVFFYANAFTIFENKPTGGLDLNPALQSNFIAIHPPILYLGHALTFGLWGIAIANYKDLRIVWLSKLCFLVITIGIVLGSLWAYQELGWGGFWFWDPVEIVSLLPWLILAAAIHTKNFYLLNILAISVFPVILSGLALVRSGILISVHSFGFDINTGLILAFITFMVITISIFFGKKNLPHNQHFSFFKEWPSAIFILLMVILAAVILIPIKIHASFDEDFFKKFIDPLILLLLFLNVAAFYVKSAANTICLALLAAACWHLNFHPYLNYLAIAAAFVSFLLIFAVLPYIKISLQNGFVFAHLGVGLCVLGASHSGIFETTTQQLLTKETLQIKQYTLQLESQKIMHTSNATKEILVLNCNGKKLQPKRSYYNIPKIYKHQPDWTSLNFDNLHATVFVNNSNQWMVELLLKPFINLLWLGLAFVVLGISISIYRKLLNVHKQSHNSLLFSVKLGKLG